MKSWTRNGSKYVKLVGILDYSTAVLFNTKLGSIEGLVQLKIDMRAIKFVDSTGIFVLTELINQCKEKSIIIKLINIPLGVYEIFKILGLNQVFGDDIFNYLDIKYG